MNHPDPVVDSHHTFTEATCGDVGSDRGTVINNWRKTPTSLLRLWCYQTRKNIYAIGSSVLPNSPHDGAGAPTWWLQHSARAFHHLASWLRSVGSKLWPVGLIWCSPAWASPAWMVPSVPLGTLRKTVTTSPPRDLVATKSLQNTSY